MSSHSVSSVKKQYELWPYPQMPLWATLHRESLWQINYEWISRKLGLFPERHPRIWIAGCGTFQPYPFSRANPRAEIIATDLSEASLSRAKKRCLIHGIKNVSFQTIDLTNPDTYPKGKFDFIECYGVLMSLPEPEKVLRELSKRLNPNGILRIMVYTHYGRQRIFQIQKLAKLLGLGPHDKKHPRILKKLMGLLPEDHPLKSTFFDYPDAENLPGIVDGFLHASDQGFTGERIARALDSAGLKLGLCFHRPWGQPLEMAEKLELSKKDPAFWLHYLDLWQSLKSNFILCVVPKEISPSSKGLEKKQHPLFDFRSPVGLRHKMRLAKLAVLGTQVQSRTHETALRLSGKEVRGLLKGQGETAGIREILAENSVRLQNFFETSQSFPEPSDPWAFETEKSPNPLYRHLFDAYTFHEEFQAKGESLPDLAVQIEKWKGQARPLETEDHPWGLTPCGTYQARKNEIQQWLRERKGATRRPFHEVKLKEGEQKREEVRAFLRNVGGIPIPSEPEVLDQLWVLLLSQSQLFLEVEFP
jgi:SAM-dependent methyltransferase